MSAARRGASGPPANAALRGGLLILAAVIVGVLLLSRGFDEDGGLVAAGDDGASTTDTTAADDDSTDTTAADDETTDTTAADGTTDTTAAATVRPAEETRFIVLNGTTTNGAASSLSSQLSALGYVPGTPGNVSGGAPDSGIYHDAAWQAEALRMATELGVGAELVVPLPPPFEVEMGDATILVVIGTDGLIAPT